MWLRSRKELNAKQRNGSMILHPAKRKKGQVSGFMGMRPMDFACEVGATFSFDPKTEWEEAGLMIYLASEFHYRIGKQKRNDGVYLIMERTAEDMVQRVLEQKIGPGPLSVRIQTGKEMDSFWVREEGKDWDMIGPLSNRFLSCEVSGRCFTGTLIGLYAWSIEDTDSQMEVTDFYQKCI